MCVNNLPKVATQWNSGATRDSNRGRRVLIPSAITARPPSHTATISEVFTSGSCTLMSCVVNDMCRYSETSYWRRERVGDYLPVLSLDEPSFIEYAQIAGLHADVSPQLMEKKISHRQLGPLRGSSSPFQHFEPARVRPN